MYHQLGKGQILNFHLTWKDANAHEFLCYQMHTDAYFQKVWPVQCNLTVHGFDRKSILCLFTITILRVSVPQIVQHDNTKLLFTCDDYPNITCLQVSSVKRTIGEAMSINEEMQLKHAENYVQLQYPNFELIPL